MEESDSIDLMIKPQDAGGINEILYRDWKSNQSVERTL
jgi:hypothetical protein